MGIKAFCRCGQVIWVEFKFNGINWYARFYDNKYKEITECPNCGESLWFAGLVKEEDLQND